MLLTEASFTSQKRNGITQKQIASVRGELYHSEAEAEASLGVGKASVMLKASLKGKYHPLAADCISLRQNVLLCRRGS